jgi:hypothetical protein
LPHRSFRKVNFGVDNFALMLLAKYMRKLRIKDNGNSEDHWEEQ